MTTPYQTYSKRIRQYQRLILKQTHSSNRIVFFKILLIIIGIVAVAYLVFRRNYPVGGGVLFFLIFGFVVLDIRHKKILRRIDYATILLSLNENSVKRLHNEWTGFPDTGAEFSDENHSYASDLDIFGKGSLFQLINCTTTWLGRRTLAGFLSQSLKSAAPVQRRQEAVTELASNPGWRQRFQTEGMLLANKIQDPDPLWRWGAKYNPFYCQPTLKIILRVLPSLTILAIIAANLHLPGSGRSIIPGYIPWIALLIQLLLLLPGRKKRHQALDIVYHYRNTIKTYERLFKHFEHHRFQSSLLKSLQTGLRNASGQTVSQQIAQLDKIADWIANRYNGLFYLFLNILTLWDYQCLVAIESWKKESGRHLPEWWNVLAEVEALSSLAILRFDHPDWVYPKFTTGTPQYKAKGMAHPLLPETRVANDLNIIPPVSALLITGSNMSGKSTYLRTAGINLVLAYAGAPVCASEFRCSFMDVHSCMRISDNLEKNISTFYAELLRIKEIVAAVQTGKPVFFLLDEIFKGTNSMDRHTGAEVLIKQLISQGALGMVSTHDLELGRLETEMNGRVKNYYFREFYKDDQIHFDYTLRDGVSTTRNAMYLIKAVGIKIPASSAPTPP
jgi:DNA mismatch repair ATPase MutS